MKIGIFCQFDAPFKAVADITTPVMHEYAERHGYDITVDQEPIITRSIVWDRYEILARNLKRYDWVVHMDADVLITNLHIRLEEFLQVDKDAGIVISQCLTEDGRLVLNDGVAFFKNMKGMENDVLRDAFNAEAEGIHCGQDWLQAVFEDDAELFHIERHKAINAFLYEEYGMPSTTIGNWTPGDFVLHLPGRTNARRVELFTQIAPQILR